MEGIEEYTVRASGVFKNLYVRVTANTLNAGTNTVTFRKNQAATSQLISFGTSTGAFEDTSNNVTVAATDEVDYEVAVGSSSGSCSLTVISNTFTADSNTYQNLAARSSTGSAFTDNTTRYEILGSSIGAGITTESQSNTTFKYAGTLKNGFVYVSQNDVSNASTVRTRKNNTTNGNIAVSITGNTTGIFEDTSNTDTITVDDEWNYQVVIPAVGGVHTVTIIRISVGLETTSHKYLLQSGRGGGAAQANNLTRYYGLGSLVLTEATTEANTSCKSRLVFTGKDMQVNVTANTFTTLDTNFIFRKNQATDVITLPVAAASTGIFQDNSETGAIIATDEINWEVVTPNQAGSITFREIAVWADALSTNTKTFTIDSLIKKTQTKTFTIDSIIKKTFTQTFTVDSIIKATFTKTFTMDSIIVAGATTKTFTMDSIILKTQTKTFTMDGIILKTFTQTFTMDSIIKATFTKTFTVDSFILKTQSKTFTINSFIKATFTKAFTVDSIIKATFSKTFTMDGIIAGAGATFTKTFTIDSIIARRLTKTFTMDGLIAGPSVLRGHATHRLKPYQWTKWNTHKKSRDTEPKR